MISVARVVLGLCCLSVHCCSLPELRGVLEHPEHPYATDGHTHPNAHARVGIRIFILRI